MWYGDTVKQSNGARSEKKEKEAGDFLLSNCVILAGPGHLLASDPMEDEE